MGFDASAYCIRSMQAADFGAIREICRRVYPHEAPYTEADLAEHRAVYPQGQFVAEHLPTASVAGVHFTLRLMMADFHLDDPWDVLTDRGSFANHNPRRCERFAGICRTIRRVSIGRRRSQVFLASPCSLCSPRLIFSEV